MPRSPGGVSRVAHGACRAPPRLPQREGARLPPGPRRASRLLFQGFHPVPGALWGGRLSSPQTACGAARQLFGGFSGTATLRPTGRVRWVMWLLLKRGPVSKSFLYPLIRFLKFGEGIPRLVVLVGSARQPGPRPPKSPGEVGQSDR
jgi:hypothetical protein